MSGEAIVADGRAEPNGKKDGALESGVGVGEGVLSLPEYANLPVGCGARSAEAFTLGSYRQNLPRTEFKANLDNLFRCFSDEAIGQGMWRALNSGSNVMLSGFKNLNPTDKKEILVGLFGEAGAKVIEQAVVEWENPGLSRSDGLGDRYERGRAIMLRNPEAFAVAFALITNRQLRAEDTTAGVTRDLLEKVYQKHFYPGPMRDVHESVAEVLIEAVKEGQVEDVEKLISSKFWGLDSGVSSEKAEFEKHRGEIARIVQEKYKLALEDAPMFAALHMPHRSLGDRLVVAQEKAPCPKERFGDYLVDRLERWNSLSNEISTKHDTQVDKILVRLFGEEVATGLKSARDGIYHNIVSPSDGCTFFVDRRNRELAFDAILRAPEGLRLAWKMYGYSEFSLDRLIGGAYHGWQKDLAEISLDRGSAKNAESIASLLRIYASNKREEEFDGLYKFVTDPSTLIFGVKNPKPAHIDQILAISGGSLEGLRAQVSQ